jgi:hypothetical protein
VTPPGSPARRLPEVPADQFDAVPFYRGARRPHRTVQLRACLRAQDNFAEVDVAVISFLGADEMMTGELIAKHGHSFPDSHRADSTVVMDLTAACVNVEPTYL